MTPSLATLKARMALTGQSNALRSRMDRHLFIVKKTILPTVRNLTDADNIIQEVLAEGPVTGSRDPSNRSRDKCDQR
jgi:hypothetical protein